MGLESVEIIMAWEESFGISFSEAEAARMFTTRSAVDAIYGKRPLGGLVGEWVAL